MHTSAPGHIRMSTMALAAFLVLVALSAGAQSSAKPSLTFASADALSTAEREIRTVEQEMHEAYVKGDRARFRGLYADDATFTYNSGRTVGAEQRAKELRAFPDLRDMVISVRLYGPATAIVNVQSEYAGEDGKPVKLQIMRVWVRLGTTWKVAAFQSTPMS